MEERSWHDTVIINGLLTELCTWMLIYTEGANLRHTTEMLWFLHWCLLHSPGLEELWLESLPEQPPAEIRDVRVKLRNEYQVSVLGELMSQLIGLP